MPDVGAPRATSRLSSHTSTNEWQSFEFRMRKRRADRCVLRAEVALEAGFEEDARAALDEARRLDSSSPDFETLREAVAARRAEEGRLLRRDRRRRVSRYVAAAALVTAIGAAMVALRDDQPRATTQALASTEASAAPAVGTAGIERASFVKKESPAPRPSTEAPPPERIEKPSEPPAREPAQPAERPEPPPAPRERPERGDDPPASAVLPPPTEVPPAALAAVAAPPVAVPVERPVNELPGTTAAPPPVPPAAPRLEPSASTDLPNVRAVLARYESAYSTLDASAAQSVWPGVDGRSLARAFESLESQRVSLGRCSISIDGSTASATCSGSATWTPRVGGGTRTEPRRWRFQLANTGGAWQIVRADVR